MIRRGFVVFNWHQIAPTFDPLRHHIYTWTSLDLFRKHLDFIHEEFRIVSLAEGVARLKKGAIDERYAALTLDDGDVSLAEHVVPMLTAREIPATFFINTAYLDRSASYWFPVLFSLAEMAGRSGDLVAAEAYVQLRIALRQTTHRAWYDATRLVVEPRAAAMPHLERQLVSTSWLTALDDALFSIGAHGHEHQRFGLMPDEWQARDLRQNLEHLSGFPAFRPLFAVPFGRPGDWTQTTLRTAATLDLDVVLADGGINTRDAEAYRRIPCDGRDVETILKAAAETRSIRSLLRSWRQ